MAIACIYPQEEYMANHNISLNEYHSKVLKQFCKDLGITASEVVRRALLALQRENTRSGGDK